MAVNNVKGVTKMKNAHTFKPGDKVMFARAHLRNIGVYTGEMCFVIGTVTNVEKWAAASKTASLITVVWTGYSPSWPASYIRTYEGTEQRVLSCNLEKSPFGDRG
jgi:hypothetical protein